MAQLIIAQNKGIQSVTYALPNKHYVPVDMRYLAVENMQPSVNYHSRSILAAIPSILTGLKLKYSLRSLHQGLPFALDHQSRLISNGSGLITATITRA
jgi:hypothetical protein